MFKSLNKAISTPIAIIIVIVAGLLAIGGVLAYQYWWAPEKEVGVSTDETADWKIYRNEEYGFEIKYPSEWKFYDEKVIVTFCGPEYWQGAEDCRMAGKGSSAAIVLRNDSLDIYRENFCVENPLNIFCGELLSRKKTTIGGREGEIFEINLGNRSSYALWKKNSSDKQMYQMSADELNDFPEHHKIFNQMLSTFRFIESEKEKEQAELPVSLNIDGSLEKMFPGYEVRKGKIEVLKSELYDVEISVDKALKDNPVFLDEDRALLIAKMTGIPHFYGGYRVFLAVFDLQSNLLTSPFSIPKPSSIGDLVKEGKGSLDILKRENGAFAVKGFGQFFFYDCRGVKYILFEEKFCVTAFCYGGANLYKAEGNKFINAQKIASSIDSTAKKIVLAVAPSGEKNIMVIPGKNKISIYVGKAISEGFTCPTECLDWSGKPIETISRSDVYIFYKDEELYWNNNSCKFE